MKQKKNKKSLNNKNEPITISLKGFGILLYNHVEPGLDIISNFDISKLKVGFNIDFAYNLDNNGFQLILSILYSYNLNDKDIVLLELKLLSEFLISDMKSVIKIVGGNLKIPDDLLVKFTSIAYSTARGIVFSKTLGSFLNQFTLPLIDPKEIVQNKLKSMSANKEKITENI